MNTEQETSMRSQLADYSTRELADLAIRLQGVCDDHVKKQRAMQSSIDAMAKQGPILQAEIDRLEGDDSTKVGTVEWGGTAKREHPSTLTLRQVAGSERELTGEAAGLTQAFRYQPWILKCPVLHSPMVSFLVPPPAFKSHTSRVIYLVLPSTIAVTGASSAAVNKDRVAPTVKAKSNSALTLTAVKGSPLISRLVSAG